MTCIVGLVNKGNIYIGGDSAGIAGWELTLRKDKKVFRTGSFLIGFTSSFRMGQLLKYTLNLPVCDADIDIECYMATAFVDAVRDCFKAGGYAQKTNEQENGGKFLVGFRGRLFCIDPDYQVGESIHGYDAVGCGAEVARGALFATSNLPPKKRIKTALRAAEQWNAGVRGPFVVESLISDGRASTKNKPTGYHVYTSSKYLGTVGSMSDIKIGDTGAEAAHAHANELLAQHNGHQPLATELLYNGNHYKGTLHFDRRDE